jgi:hypothetical protein
VICQPEGGTDNMSKSKRLRALKELKDYLIGIIQLEAEIYLNMTAATYDDERKNEIKKTFEMLENYVKELPMDHNIFGLKLQYQDLIYDNSLLDKSEFDIVSEMEMDERFFIKEFGERKEADPKDFIDELTNLYRNAIHK